VRDIVRREPRHVTTYALGPRGVNLFRKCCVTGAADIADLARAVRSRSMRIVAGSAPQLAAAGSDAFAERQLFGLFHGFQLLIVFGEQVSNGSAFQLFARMKIPPGFPGIQQAVFAFQMALLADAVAGARRKLGRVNNIVRGGQPRVLLARPVAPVAANRIQRRSGIAPAIAPQELAVVRMAKQTCGIDQPVEIGTRHVLIAGRGVPTVLPIPGSGRFIQVVADPHQVGVADLPRPDLVRHRIFGRQAVRGE